MAYPRQSEPIQIYVSNKWQVVEVENKVYISLVLQMYVKMNDIFI
jgi:hypothetical protein